MEELVVSPDLAALAWERFKRKNLRPVYNELTFDYKKTKGSELVQASLWRRGQIAEALCFWHFISSSVSMDWVARKEALAQFLDPKKGYSELIQAVARLESLPTGLFRQLLWQYNLDFVSGESFLRRLTKSQIEGIGYEYARLWEEGADGAEKYKIFKGLLVPRLTREQHLSCTFDRGKRYTNVVAMSYNFLGWDFGFNAYPQGRDNDTHVTDVSPARFFSLKNRVNDFSVNKEYGLYFWLYRTARSNPAFSPDKKVQLKPHVCPGFWYTIFSHFLFWIISPLWLFGVLTAQLAFEGNWILAITLGWPALITPGWLAIAGARKAGKALKTYYIKRSEEREKGKKKSKKIQEAIVIMVTSLLSIGVMTMLGRAFISIAEEYHPLLAAMIFAAIFLATIDFMASNSESEKEEGAKEEAEEKKEPEGRSFIWFVRRTHQVIFAMIGLFLIITNAGAIWGIAAHVGTFLFSLFEDLGIGLANGIATAAVFIYEAAVKFGIIIATLAWRTGWWSLGLLVPVIVSFSAWGYGKRTIKNPNYNKAVSLNRREWIPEWLIKLGDILFIVFIIGAPLAVIGPVVYYLFVGTAGLAADGEGAVFIMVIQIIAFLAFLVGGLAINEYRWQTQRADADRDELSQEIGVAVSRRAAKDLNWLIQPESAKSPRAAWFKTLEFLKCDERRYIITKYFKQLSPEAAQRLEEADGMINIPPRDRLRIVEMVIHGKKFSEAVEALNIMKAAEEKKAEAFANLIDKVSAVIRRIGKIVSWPFMIIGVPILYIIKGIIWLVRKVIDFLRHLRFFRELFSERCPHIAEEQQVRI